MDIRSVLEKMITLRASDLHLKAGTPPVVRVDGVLYALEDAPLTPQELRELCNQLLNDEQRTHFASHSEIDFAFGVSQLARFRANIFMQRGTPAMALRHVPVHVPTIEELKLPPVVRELVFSPRGLILVTGTTGSGKSTTLAAMIDTLNRVTSRNIVTVEDPIEFLHVDRLSYIHQREVGLDTRSFHDGLKYVLRQDPDVILIGEIRDLDTMRTVLMAADSGHLCLSTMHTTDVVQTIQRIISFYPPHQHEELRIGIASNLRAVITQRLIPRCDGGGRVPAVEVMVSTPTIQEYIINAEKTPLIHGLVAEGGTQYGMVTFDQSVLSLLRDGLISEEDALKNCSHPNEVMLKLKGILAATDRAWQGPGESLEGPAPARPGAPGHPLGAARTGPAASPAHGPHTERTHRP